MNIKTGHSAVLNQALASLPAGVILTNRQLDIQYMNSQARQVLQVQAGQPVSLKDFSFYTTDRQVFHMEGCMQQMLAGGSRRFHKTLIFQHAGREKLLYVTAGPLDLEDIDSARPADFSLFCLVDISSEMDCVTPASGGFGRYEYLLSRTLIGRDHKMREIYRMIALAADSMVNVMITGESGTGKELVAEGIHALSSRSKGPMIRVNCAALSESLLESELFGHAKGAFTGAVKDKPGKFEVASGGTLFLDEIGEISPSLQVKLLRVIQEKTIERVGENRSIPVDIRIVAATNQDLASLIAEGRFREDLYYRLNVFAIHMPPLRSRPLDIPVLCAHFISRFSVETGKQIKGASRAAMRLLMNYPWPGNVRELQNAIEHAFVLVQGSLIEPADLPPVLRQQPHENLLPAESPLPDAGKDPGFLPGVAHTHQGAGSLQYPTEASLHNIRKTPGGRLPLSREQLLYALQLNDHNQSRTAEWLGISRVALWRKMKKLGMITD